MRVKAKSINVFGKTITPYVYLTPTITLMLVLLVIPIGMVIYYSFFDNVIINDSPQFVGLANFITILGDNAFWSAVRNTSFFVGFSVLFHFILGMTFALLLNTSYFGARIKGIFRVLYVLPWMFTASVIAILWRLMLNPNGIVNYYLMEVFSITADRIEWLGSRQFALIAITFINIWAGYPFFMISILAGLQGISNDLYEAAAIDGAGSVKQFLNVTIPSLKPILISLLMLDFVWTIQQFALIWMTTGGGPAGSTETLSTLIFRQGFTRNQFALASTSATIVLLVCTAVAILYVRHQKARD